MRVAISTRPASPGTRGRAGVIHRADDGPNGAHSAAPRPLRYRRPPFGPLLGQVREA